jgi:hypothetical protein
MQLTSMKPVPGMMVSVNARKKMFSVGEQIVSASSTAILGSPGEKALRSGKDLLSVLLKANMSTDTPETQRLSDAEVIARECALHLCQVSSDIGSEIAAFLIAGYLLLAFLMNKS